MTDGRFVSYAQHGEDVVLWRALGPRTDVFYVDIGAYHPTFDSVTKALYERGWRGINVEAQPDRIGAFEEERPEDINLAIAIGDHDGTATLTVPKVPGWASTLAPEVTHADADEVATVEVPLRTLPTLLAEYGITTVDVLKVDVEGAEPAVVRGMLDGPVRPTVCVVEGVAPGLGQTAGRAAVDLLVEAGYEHCLFDGLNHYLTCAPDLAEALSVPANPLDEYVTDLVERLVSERIHQTAVISRLVAENAELRGMPARPGADQVVTPDARETSAAAVALAAINTASSPDAGDLPFPGGAPVTAAETEIAVPTQAVDAILSEDPAAAPQPLVDPGTRRSRRRATFVRLLHGARVLPSARPGAAMHRTHMSLEAIPPADAVAVLYRVILGRDPDPEGLTAWVTRVEAGTPLLAVAQDFARSEEAALAHEAHRAQVQADLALWASSVAVRELGAARASGVTYIPGLVAHQILVEALYEVALNRQPTPDEMDLQVGLLVRGAGTERMIRAFATLPEARAAVLGTPAAGPRALLVRWRDRRGYLAGFRSRVSSAEQRRIGQLQLHLTVAEVVEAAPTRPGEVRP